MSGKRTIISVCVSIALVNLLLLGSAKGVTDNASILLELASEKFGALTEADKKLFRAVANGDFADYSAEDVNDNNPADANKWSPERVLKANRIEWLCTDKKASELVTHRGINVKGLRIDEDLALQLARIPFPLIFHRCAFTGIIYLQSARVRGIYLNGTHTRSIFAGGIEIAGDLFLRDGFKAEGEVRLLRATISRVLNCEDGQFLNKGAMALNANDLNVEGDVYLRKGFKAEGEVCLRGATIGGQLSCIGGHFVNAQGYALGADAASINSSVFLCNGFRAEGEVCLLRAKINGNLVCDGGQFSNPEGHALNANGASIAGSVLLRNGFKAEGNVALMGSTIDEYFQLWAVDSPEKYTLDLRDAEVGTLYDKAGSWPESDALFLNGLVYDSIADKAQRDAVSRIKWLRRQPEGFRPQPYEQLAAVLRKSGDEEGAKEVLIAKNKDKAWLTKLTWSEWFWYRIFGWIIGYGYRPLQAFWIGLVFIVLGLILFDIGYCVGLITPHSESAYVQKDTGIVVPGDKTRHLSDVYPRFSFLMYSIDVFIPLVDLHQAKYWLPNANRGPEYLNIKGISLRVGGMFRFYMWIHIMSGWVLTSLLVVGLTGLVRT